ncbi:LOW QUALITY PROTEIN: hypothetical protein V2J09_017740 [Rumex salicifolius]
MIPCDGCKAKQIASAPRTEDCRCESACPTDFLSVRVYLWHETTRKFLLTIYVFCYHFQPEDPLIQLVEDYNWIRFFDFHWRLRIDGISIGPVLLTGFITTLATLVAWPITRDSQLFHFLMLEMYSGQIGLFSSRDLLLFFSNVGINMELLPHAHSIFSPWLMIAGTVQIIYAASTSSGQRNLKKRIAYSSISHMGCYNYRN